MFTLVTLSCAMCIWMKAMKPLQPDIHLHDIQMLENYSNEKLVTAVWRKNCCLPFRPHETHKYLVLISKQASYVLRALCVQKINKFGGGGGGMFLLVKHTIPLSTCARSKFA